MLKERTRTMADGNDEDPRKIEERMALEAERRKGAKPLPASSKLDPVEANYRKQANATRTALNSEIRQDVVEQVAQINGFRNPERRVKDIVIRFNRDTEETVDDFGQRTNSLYDKAEDTEREIQVLTSPGGVHPDTISLRMETIRLCFLLVLLDGIGNVLAIFMSGALSGGVMGALVAGLLPPALAVLSGKACGDWFLRWARQIRIKPLLGSLGGLAIVINSAFVFYVVQEFASFRDAIDAEAAAYLSLCLMGFNFFAFLMSFFLWAKTPAASPELKIQIDRLEDIQYEIKDRYEAAGDQLVENSEASLEGLESLSEQVEEEVADVATANDELADVFADHQEDMDAAREDFEGQINGHRQRLMAMSDSAKSVPYLNKEADLSAVFISTFDYPAYKAKTEAAQKSLTDLDTLVEAASDEIDLIRETAFSKLKTQREKDPTL